MQKKKNNNNNNNNLTLHFSITNCGKVTDLSGQMIFAISIAPPPPYFPES